MHLKPEITTSRVIELSPGLALLQGIVTKCGYRDKILAFWIMRVYTRIKGRIKAGDCINKQVRGGIMMGSSANDKQKATEMGRACVCFNIRKSTRLLTAHYDRVMNPTGLKATQFSLLMTVLQQDTASVSQLANILGMDRTTLSRNVRLLEKKALISVSPGEDRREQRIALTDRGRKAIDQAMPFWEKAQAEVVAIFGEEWVQGFLTSLKQLNRLKS